MYAIHSTHKKAFSLIELLVVISIIAVLLTVALPNFLSARERARDARKKQELNEMKNALRLYYNDFQAYPASSQFCNGKTNNILGCGLTHIACCPAVGCSGDFAVGDVSSGCVTLYMKKFPVDFGQSIFYPTSSDTDSFCLKTTLDNAADPDIAASQARCLTQCPGQCSGLDYCVCAD
jgi:prepilin-type N-terminal cleavage/methylation domain-containing protein